MSDRDLKTTLAEEFADKEYAHSYMHQHLLERFATQLHAVRSDQGLSQEDLAELSGVPQSKISRLECADVGSFTLGTALKLAKALDVALALRFEPFSHLIRNVDRSSSSDLAVQSRGRDLQGCRSMNRLLHRVHVPSVAATTAAYLDVLKPVPVIGVDDIRLSEPTE